jgi:hypothetical protein
VKIARIALSIPLTLLAGAAGAAVLIYLFLASVISILADRVYGGSLSHDVTNLILSSQHKTPGTD